MTELPPGWGLTTLGEIAETSLGKMLDRGKDVGENAVPYLRNTNVQWGRIDLSDILTMEIPAREQDFFRLVPGDLLVCEGGEIGRCAIWPEQPGYMAYQKALHRIRPHRDIEVGYLRYLMEHMSIAGLLAPYSTGSTIKHLPQQQLRRIKIALPPAAEQRRMVAALEEYASRIDSAAVSIESAFGRAKKLRARFLAESVTDPDGTWDHYLLGQIIESVRNGIYISRPGADPDGVPILRIGAVRALRLQVADIRYSGKSADEIDRNGYLLRAGDLLFTRYNGNPEYVGSCAVVPGGLGHITYPDKLIRVRVNESYVLPEYLAIACSTGESRAAIRQFVKTTAGQAGISGKELRSVPVRLPSLSAQERLVAGFAERDQSVQELEFALTSARQKAFLLRRVLLREAFEGRLVAQNVADESATALLRRIRAGRSPQDLMQRGRVARTPQNETLL
jgi:type I restriction enzyme, S subunit